MLTKIGIQGFKSVYNIQDLELGQVNVFIGANGSGKSNLLEAVGMLSAAVAGRVDAKHLLERGVRHGGPGLYKTSLKKEKYQPLTLKAEGRWNGIKAKYEVHLDNSLEKPTDTWQYLQEHLWRDNTEILERRLTKIILANSDLYQSSGVEDNSGVFNSLIKGGFKFPDNALTEFYNILNRYVIFAPTTPVLRGIQPDIVPLEPLGLLGGRLAEAIEDILDPEKRRLGGSDLDDVLNLLDWVDEFDITAPSRKLLSPHVPSLRSIIRFKDYWMGKKRNELSGYDASEGALYVLFTLVSALHPYTPVFFAIDNFDQSLNPRLARSLARIFCKLIIESAPRRQVFLTIHNPSVLDGLDLRDSRIRLFAVDRTRSTKWATEARRIQVSDEVLNATEHGLSLSNLWVMGRLGGVPNLS